MSDEKRVLILQHIEENPPGRVGDILQENMIPYDNMCVGKDPLPDLSIYHALIILGGTQHVYDKDKYPYTAREEAYLHRAIRQEIPCLGLCLGGQLLANAFGATVMKLPKVHIGFIREHFTEAGKKDPLYKGLPGYQLAFQWHEDGFALPVGAVPIAVHEDGANQAFRYGRHVYGLQYHVEVTIEMLDTWLHDPSLQKEFVDMYGVDIYHQTEREIPHLYPIYHDHSRIMIENFLRICELL